MIHIGDHHASQLDHCNTSWDEINTATGGHDRLWVRSHDLAYEHPGIRREQGWTWHPGGDSANVTYIPEQRQDQ